MISFFRKIRQKLLTKNRVTQYFIYAIGEILLVVIGILIALSINNWNEWRKERISEKVLLTDLRSDFDENIRQLNSDIERKANTIQTINILYDLIAGEISLEEVTLDAYLEATYTVINFTQNRSTVRSITENGKIELIQSEELKNSLDSWISAENQNKLYTTALANVLREKYMPTLTDYVSIRNVLETREQEINPFIPDELYELKSTTKSKHISDYPGLFADQKFESHLSLMERLQLSSLNQNYRLLEIAEHVIQYIDIELSKE